MSNYAKIYWLTRLDGLHHFFTVMLVISSIAIIAIIFGCIMHRDFDDFHNEDEVKSRKNIREKLQSKIKYLVFATIIGVLGSILLPTEKQAIFIFAGGKTIDFIETDTSISKIPSQTTTLISDFMEKQIQELNEKKESEKK